MVEYREAEEEEKNSAVNSKSCNQMGWRKRDEREKGDRKPRSGKIEGICERKQM